MLISSVAFQVLAAASSQSALETKPSSSLALPITHYNINYLRQADVAFPTPTLSFNWSPYSPGVTPSTLAPAVSFSLPSDTIIAPALTTSNTITNSASTETATPMSSTSSIQNSSIISSSLIYITALPPSNTTTPSSTFHKMKPHRPTSFKLIYLAPLFALIGIIFGSVSAWFCYGCYSARRQPRYRAPSLEPGPPYSPGRSDIYNDKLGYGSREDYDDDDDDEGSPSKHSRHGSKYTGTRSHWLTRGPSSRSSRHSHHTTKPLFSWPAPTPTPKGYEHEDDPFLAPPRANRAKSNTGKSLFSSPDPLSLLAADEELDRMPYESLRHTSIRRGILEKLKFGSFRQSNSPEMHEGGRSVSRHNSSSLRHKFGRPGHGRTDSDLCLDEVNLTLPERTYSSADSRKNRSSIRESKGNMNMGDETEWVEGSGFRIVEEDLEAIRTQMKGSGWGRDDRQKGDGSSFRSGLPSASKPGDSIFHWPLDDPSPVPVKDDKYTVLPLRKSPTKGKIPGRVRTGRTPISSRAPASTSKRLGRVDSSILPLSPPQITSPPLESKLFFTPTLQQQSAAIHEDGRRMAAKTTTRCPGKQGKKPRSPLPTYLPFPSSDDYRNRLLKAQTRTPERNKNVPTPRYHASTSHRSGKEIRGARAPEKYTSRRDALSKVDQIVSQSWSERDLKGVGGATSPTMFGAVQ